MGTLLWPGQTWKRTKPARNQEASRDRVDQPNLLLDRLLHSVPVRQRLRLSVSSASMMAHGHCCLPAPDVGLVPVTGNLHERGGGTLSGIGQQQNVGGGQVARRNAHGGFEDDAFDHVRHGLSPYSSPNTSLNSCFSRTKRFSNAINVVSLISVAAMLGSRWSRTRSSRSASIAARARC